MPRGYKKDTGETCGGKNDPSVARAAQKAKGAKPGYLLKDPTIRKKVVQLYMDEGMTATQVANLIDDPRVTANTIYSMASRIRKAEAKALKAATRGKPMYGNLPIIPKSQAEELEISDDQALVVPDNEVRVTERARRFLRESTQQTQHLYEKALTLAATKLDESDATAADTALRAADRAVNLVRKVSGVEDEERRAGKGPPAQHLHLHGGGAAPFGG